MRKDEKGSLKTKKVRERRKKCAIFFYQKDAQEKMADSEGYLLGVLMSGTSSKTCVKTINSA